jgi:ATP-dependent protease HslVU (ClpYQ) peptidase subunit
MTCIIGYLKDSVVHIAADSQITCGTRIDASDYEKILINGDIVGAFSGNLHCVNALESEFKKIQSDKVTSLKNDLHDNFLKPVRDLIKRREIPDSYINFRALIAKKNELIETDNHYAILDINEKFSIGSGAYYALGSLEALDRVSTLSLEQKLKTSILVANNYDTGTNDNIKYCNTKDLKIIKL